MVKSLLVQSIQRRERKKDTDSRYGQMAVSMKGSGLKTRPKDMEGSYWVMVTSTRENGKMIKLTAMVTITMQREQLTKEDGSRTSKKVMAERSGQMVATILEATCAARNMETDCSCGLMEPNMRASGEITKCMARVSSSGAMAESISVITSTTRSMAKASIRGLMEECIMADSIMESSMGKVSISRPVVNKFTECGIRERKTSYARINKNTCCSKTTFDRSHDTNKSN
jgi:hypothetical protein